MENRKKTSESVDLTAAKAIVCLGRGVADEDGFEMCKGLASAIGAELGCTRPVTETEKPLMPRSAYIGSSGNTVKPGLFVSVTASGQTQFVMGMYESGKIVAVNKDPNALIFRQCDYGIVGDYTEIVPAITKALGA